MATSWQALLTNDGQGNYTVTVKYDGALSGGTSLTLPEPDVNAFEYIYAVFERIRRRIMNAFSSGTINTTTDNVAFNIAIDGGTGEFTGTAKYGGVSISGGTSVTMALNEQDATFFLAAFERAQRRILNAISSGT